MDIFSRPLARPSRYWLFNLVILAASVFGGVEAHATTLAQALTSLKEISPAVEISIAANLANDPSPVARIGTAQALATVLHGYNHMAIAGNKGLPMKIVVTSRNGDYVEAPVHDANALVIGTQPASVMLPEVYQGISAERVSQVQLPVQQLVSMAASAKATLKLPRGQFEVIHDRMVQDSTSGLITWNGHLDIAGAERYEVVLKIGLDGCVGQINTPNGVYVIDNADEGSWLVDTSLAGIMADANEIQSLGSLLRRIGEGDSGYTS